MILLLDNYDSFTHNLAHAIKKITKKELHIVRNDAITVNEADKFDIIFLSPGPGVPDEAGILKPLIKRYMGKKPIFGVCLGCQAIGEVLGGKLLNLDSVYHGVSTPMTILKEDEEIFKGLANPFPAGRYHSWVIDRASLPQSLIVTCEEENGQVMAITHKEWNLRGVQFHPESILTPEGELILENFLRISGGIQ